MSKTEVRILIVDDEEADRTTYKRMLTPGNDYEYVVQEAETAQEGLDMFQEEPAHCILLDYRLPDLDGMEFLEEIRGSHLAPPIVMVTGQGNEDLAIRAILSGAQDYLVKGELTWPRLHVSVQNTIWKSSTKTIIGDKAERLEGIRQTVIALQAMPLEADDPTVETLQGLFKEMEDLLAGQQDDLSGLIGIRQDAPKIRVLFTDDSPDDLEIFKQMLKPSLDMEFEVTTAEMGEEALEACRKTTFDCLLLDYSLPDLDGIQVLEELKNIENAPPVIMMTGLGNEAVAIAAIEGGAQDYLVKGAISEERLQYALFNAVERAQLKTRFDEQTKAFKDVYEAFEKLTNQFEVAIDASSEGSLTESLDSTMGATHELESLAKMTLEPPESFLASFQFGSPVSSDIRLVANVMVQKAAGYNMLSREEYLSLPMADRIELLLSKKLQFLDEAGEALPVREAISNLHPKRPD